MTALFDTGTAQQRLFYRSRAHQEAQHRAMLKPLGEISGHSLVDVGCGYGDLLNHLPADVRYLGTDIDDTAIKEARRLHPDHWFVCTSDIPPADYLVAAAVVSLQDEKERFAARMWAAARVAVALTYWQYVTDLDWLKALPGATVTGCDDDFFTVSAFK